MMYWEMMQRYLSGDNHTTVIIHNDTDTIRVCLPGNTILLHKSGKWYYQENGYGEKESK